MTAIEQLILMLARVSAQVTAIRKYHDHKMLRELMVAAFNLQEYLKPGSSSMDPGAPSRLVAGKSYVLKNDYVVHILATGLRGVDRVATTIGIVTIPLCMDPADTVDMVLYLDDDGVCHDDREFSVNFKLFG